MRRTRLFLSHRVSMLKYERRQRDYQGVVRTIYARVRIRLSIRISTHTYTYTRTYAQQHISVLIFASITFVQYTSYSFRLYFYTHTRAPSSVFHFYLLSTSLPSIVFHTNSVHTPW